MTSLVADVRAAQTAPTPTVPAAPLAPPSTPQAAKGDAAKSKPVYDEKADARADLKAALARAKRDHRRVLIQWGANWCGWCLKLNATMTKDKELAHEILYEYEVVHVDVGQFDKNKDLMKELGADIKGVPFLTVLDEDGKSLVQQPTDPLEINTDDRHEHDPKLVLAFLKAHQAPYLKAADLAAGALEEAKTAHRRVFLHYGAPWCGYCHMLERWMEQPEVAALLAKDFIDLKIDVDRTVGGKEAMAAELSKAYPKLTDTSNFGIPWIVFLDSGGKQLAVGSTEEKGSIGCPLEDDEIALFLKMLDAARENLTDADVQALKDSLLANQAAVKPRAAPTSPVR